MFLVPFLYMRPPSSHTWALLCTQDELRQVKKVRGVPLSEIRGVLPGTREVGGVDQGTALVARVEYNYEAKRHSPTCFGMQPNHGGCLLCCYTGYLGIFSSFLV